VTEGGRLLDKRKNNSSRESGQGEAGRRSRIEKKKGVLKKKRQLVVSKNAEEGRSQGKEKCAMKKWKHPKEKKRDALTTPQRRRDQTENSAMISESVLGVQTRLK